MFKSQRRSCTRTASLGSGPCSGLIAERADAGPRAEKAANGGSDPDLSSAGHVRADALARILKDSGITAIFTSEFKRTQETAAPTATSARVTPTVVATKDTAVLVAKLHQLNGNALVVGHGNTIPDIVKALGINSSINIPDADYSELLIVTLGDKPHLFRLHYPS